MENKIDHQTTYNLIVCYYALKDNEQMKDCFTKMLLVKYYDSELEDENEEENIIFQVSFFLSTCHVLHKISMINISNMFSYIHVYY